MNRYVCDALEEMRKLYETRNFCGLNGLIEEVQSHVNRMETVISERKDYFYWKKKVKAAKKKLKKLNKQLPEEDTVSERIY